MLGHGLSQKGKSKDKIDATVEHIKMIMEDENKDSIHIVGLSMGSLLAQYFGLLYPKQVKSIFMILFSFDKFRRHIASLSSIISEEQQKIYDSSGHFKRKSLIAMSGLGNVLKVRENVERTYPLLILCGENDIDLAINSARDWHLADPGSEFSLIDNAGHCANMDNAEQFNEVVYALYNRLFEDSTVKRIR